MTNAVRLPGSGGRLATAAAAAGLVIALVVPPSAAQAADVVSQATGRLVTTSLLSSDVLDEVLALRGAIAINPDASGDVVVDQPLDAAALAELLVLQAGSTDLFGDNGIIQLGAVGQYAQANDDGSSSAFSGAVSAAPSLVGVGTVTPSDVGAPAAGDTAQISLGSATDLAALNIGIGALAASAQQTTDGTQTGQYVLADVDVTLDGTLVGGVVSTLRPALDVLIAAAGVAGLTLTNPFADDTVTVSLDDLLAIAGVASVNDLPPGTDLISYIPAAVAAQITTSTNAILDAVQDRVDELGVLGVVLNAALGVARGVVDPLLDGLATNLVAPLATALTALVQLQVNVQSTGADGSFTETALRVGVGPAGSLASVDLASASVGPNAGELAVPVAGAESLGIAGGLAGLAVLGALGVTLVRRNRVATRPVVRD